MAEQPEPSEWQPAALPKSATRLVTEGIAPWLAPLLARRGIETGAAAEEFLRPSLEQLHDPALLGGLRPAVARLVAARDAGEKVMIVGDYDVDGISATALLTATFRACRIDVEPLLPNRLLDGYGFQSSHVEKAGAAGCTLIVTADCGSGSIGPAADALAAGIDVIVTDHHLTDLELPAGVLEINPQRPGSEYPFRFLCGAGLAFKLASAVAEACERDIDPDALLRIACLGTIADMVPLVGENRVIAGLGLAALGETRSRGLLALAAIAGLKPPYTASDVSFRLGPRINAAGRMDSPRPALDLLLTRDPAEAKELAGRLDAWNLERRAVESRVVDEAREVFLQRDPKPPIHVAWNESWHRGVVGIAAGRLARELHRPTVLLQVEAEHATGSGRSIPGVDLHAFLAPARERMERFGGHAQAIGLTVASGRLEELRDAWEAEAAAWDGDLFKRRHKYDARLEPAEVDRKLIQTLHRLEPFGVGNPQPVFRLGPLERIGKPRTFGKGHASVKAVGSDGGELEILAWNWGERLSELDSGFEVLGSFEADRYSGGTVLRLIDARPA